MTEENYRYRTSPVMLRNQFAGKGNWDMPVIPKFREEEGDFTNLRLIGFDKTNLENNNHIDRMVHFFLYDYKFERVWKTPDSDIERLRRYRAVLTPDFSVYREMARVMQLYNTFRNRWCGAYWASKGIRVIPTVSWGDENTYAFCFEGIEPGSTVAVSTYMVSAHDNTGDQKEFFLKGYDELLRRIKPERIICYHTPFPEMRGNIVYVDYALSSWRYMNDDVIAPSKFAAYLSGELPVPPDRGIVIKQGFVHARGDCLKGMGSAFGGPRLSGGEGESDSKKNKIPDNDSTTGHIFRDVEGHIPDTPENRALLEDVANDSTNFRGTDKYGNEWYTKTQSDGSQVWVESRNGNIFEGGVNNTPKPWNPETGLKEP